MIVSKMHLTKTNLCAEFLLTSRNNLTKLILLKNLWRYGIRGIANDWFKSYLTNRMQYVSINNILFQLITLRKDNAAQEALVTQYYAQIVGLSERQQHKAFYITELSLNSCGIRAQLSWPEMALFSKKALHNIEKHS